MSMKNPPTPTYKLQVLLFLPDRELPVGTHTVVNGRDFFWNVISKSLLLEPHFVQNQLMSVRTM